MPKATDITGAFRVPEESWGKFWNAMRGVPGVEIEPETRVHNDGTPHPDREANHPLSARVIILGALVSRSRRKMTVGVAWLADLLHEAGKDRGLASRILRELKRRKHVNGDDKRGYSITAAGRTFYHAQRNGGA